jgi:arginine decarboxylase-like protein
MASPKPIRGTHRAVLLRPRPGERFEDASALYGIPHWGKRFFHVSEDGNLVVRPTRDPERGVAL